MAERNEEPGGLGINGVIPGAGECATCHEAARAHNLMCDGCWPQVPLELADRLAAALRRWRRGNGTLGDLRNAQWACVEAVTADV